MLISIHDKSLQRVAYLDNEKPGTLHYCDDTWSKYLKEATSTFDFTVIKAGQDALKHLTEKNYISFCYDHKDYLFNIIKIEETEDSIKVYTENLNLELLNEDATKYTAPQAMTLEAYLNNASIVGGFSQSDLVIGINEVSAYVRTLEWTSTSTKLARLLSIVSQFDAECEFVTSLNRDGTMNKITLNIYKAHDEAHQGVGTYRSDITLYYGKEINSIRRTIDKAELYTAIRPYGKDDLDITSISRTVTDTDGHELFKTSGNGIIYAVQAGIEYPTHLSADGDKWTLLRWEYDTDDVETLYSKSLAKLKSVCEPAVTYEIEGTYDLQIGDTVHIQDDKFSPALLLEARVSEQEISFTDPSKNKNVYSNFRALENQLSDGITKRLEQIENTANSVVDRADGGEFDAILMYIHSSDGTAFKNDNISTILTVTIYHGKKTITSKPEIVNDFGSAAYIQWMVKKFGDADFTVISADDSHITNDGFTYTVSASDIDTQAVFAIQLIIP